MLKNTSTSYGWVTIILHWALALLLFGLLASGLWMVELGYYDPLYQLIPDLHMACGLLILPFLVFRILWRWVGITPNPEPGSKPWEIALARSVHLLLYLLPMAIIFSGYGLPTANGEPINLFGWVSVPAIFTLPDSLKSLFGDAHRWLAYGLGGFAVLHAAGALKHHVVNRDRTLARMIVTSHAGKARHPS